VESERLLKVQLILSWLPIIASKAKSCAEGLGFRMRILATISFALRS
jgi:hypothetical protein